jgi:hypothetical protein
VFGTAVVLGFTCAGSAITPVLAGDGVVSYQPPSFEQMPRGPVGVFAFGDLLYVPDPIDDEIVIFSRDSRQTGVIETGFDFRHAILEGSRLLLFDSRGETKAVDLAGARGGTTRSLRSQDVEAVPETYERKLMEQYDAKQATVRGALGAGRDLSPDAGLKRAIGDDRSEEETVIGARPDGSLIVSWLREADRGYETYVGAVATDGRREQARVDLSSEFVPERPLTVDAEGNVYALLPNAALGGHGGANAFVPTRVQLQADGARGGSRGGLSPDGRIDVGTLTGIEPRYVAEAFDELARLLSDEAFEEAVPRPLARITRADALNRATAFRDHQWALGGANYSRPGIASACEPESRRYWRRPARHNGQAGENIIGIPYKWGGHFEKIAVFESRLDQGFLAGDVCTCRTSQHNYCIVPEATGLDCSGFVSSSWLAPYTGTSNMKNITDRVAWDQLKGADALNRAGSHIMLFVEYATPDHEYVRVIHSAISCSGVCGDVVRRKKLKAEGYIPVRYRNIVN